MYTKIEQGEMLSGGCSGSLYIKQYVEVEKRNIGLDFIPILTRFDKDERFYLSEFFYNFYIEEHLLPVLKRRAMHTTHKLSSGEMEIVSGYVTPMLHHKKILAQGFLSPLHSSNKGYYIYKIDTLYNEKASIKVLFTQRFDNIKLLTSGWAVLSEDYNIKSLFLDGKDEQSTFNIEYTMGDDECSHLPREAFLSLHYEFAGNRLNIDVDAVYDYYSVQQPAIVKENVYNLSSSAHSVLRAEKVDNQWEFVNANRPRPLTPGDSLLYAMRNEIVDKKTKLSDTASDLLWSIGDEMISAHSLDWDGGNIKMSPIINPSYLSYSSNRGLAYKMKLKLRNRMKSGRLFSLTPLGGYNFKQKRFYWDVDSRFLFDPMNLGSITLDVGSGNRSYSSVVLDRIENSAADSLKFENLDISYFKHFYLSLIVKRELFNGFELSGGVNFHRRSIVGNLPKKTSVAGLKEVYRQLAPSVGFAWQPGMYYYIKNGRKINLGSKMPRFSLDVEQGVSKLFGSDGIYTRAEVDVQHHLSMRGDARLYLRVGGGGYFYTDDVYFADYAFLRENNLPIERSDELGGVFQLLDSEWYNAANKYFRAHATYDSPFFVLQRIFPRVNFIESESLYANILFMSHLTPYSEFGYGVKTPYVDMGIFVSGRNLKLRGIGYKITISIFRE